MYFIMTVGLYVFFVSGESVVDEEVNIVLRAATGRDF